MDGNEQRQQDAVMILETAVREKVVSYHQLMLGLRRVHQGLDELVLDVPFARDILSRMETILVEKKVISEADLPH